MEILADYELSSDLRLPDGAPPMVISSEVHQFRATITNIGLETQEEGTLACRLVFGAPDFEHSENLADQKVVKLVNALAYTTNRKFAVDQLRKIIEWTPGIRQRRAHLFQRAPLDHRAEPALTPEFGQTAEHLLDRQSDDQQHSAMRWYRLGIQSDSPEEQFSYFWFALEIAAQVLKSTDRAPSRCPVCRGPLYCERCETHPTHRPYPGEAIRQVIARVQAENPGEIFETLQKIRHTLMHGDRLATIEHELPCTTDQAVTKLAQVTWNAIAALFDTPTGAVPNQLMFGQPDTVLRHTLVARVDVLTELLADHENPRIENFPNFNFSVDFRMSPPRDI
jgi:hypothetical protein